MEDITKDEILEVFRKSDMHREIDKHFDSDSMPYFENDFVSMVMECILKCKEGK